MLLMLLLLVATTQWQFTTQQPTPTSASYFLGHHTQDPITTTRSRPQRRGVFGTIVDASGKGVEGVTVELFKDGTSVRSAVTGTDGRFRLGSWIFLKAISNCDSRLKDSQPNG